MSGRKLLLVATVIILVAVILFAKWVLHDGLSAKASPSWVEIFVARSSRQLSIPAAAKEQKNPVADSTDVQSDARLHFADHCAVCHGNDGSGDTMMGRGFYPKPPDLRAERTQMLADGELFWIIENGVRFTGMPAFGGSGDHGGETDSWKLVRFIRHLPQLTAQERLEMERYNPKGPEEREEERQEDEFFDGKTPQPSEKMEHHHH